MRKYFLKSFHFLLLVLSLTAMLPAKSLAAKECTLLNDTIALERAEQTGYIYKIMNGKQYKRLWSYTYGRWIDDDWTLV